MMLAPTVSPHRRSAARAIRRWAAALATASLAAACSGAGGGAEGEPDPEQAMPGAGLDADTPGPQPSQPASSPTAPAGGEQMPATTPPPSVGSGASAPQAGGPGAGSAEEDPFEPMEEEEADGAPEPGEEAIEEEEEEPMPEPDEPEALSFARDVHPILVESCGSCHASSLFLPRFAAVSADGSYPIAVNEAASIVSRIERGTMPPSCSGPPGSRGCVSEGDFDLIEQWVDEGTPE